MLPAGSLQQRDRPVRMSIGEEHRATGLVGPSLETGRLVGLPDLLEPAGRRLRRREVAGREPDLHLGAQQATAENGLATAAATASLTADRSRGSPADSCRSAETGLWVAPEPGGAGEVCRSPAGYAADPAHLAELVLDLGDGGDVQVGQVGGHLRGLPFGRSPRALDREKLNPVRATDAHEHHRVGELLDRALGVPGPLAGAGNVHQVDARGHDRAVDVAGPVRRDPFGDDGQHRLVEQSEPVTQVSASDLGESLAEQAESRERLVTELGAKALEVPCARRCLVEPLLLQGARDLQVGEVTVGRTARLSFEQSAPPAQPTRGQRMFPRMNQRPPRSIACRAARSRRPSAR